MDIYNEDERSGHEVNCIERVEEHENFPPWLHFPRPHSHRVGLLLHLCQSFAP
jgi:hypothetical protein